jgi:SAM-dependent methyltransferase
MDDTPRFARDLFQGTAEYYDRYRLPYPDAMITELARCGERGRLLDLACGTGQLTFPLRPWFREIWTVDREPDMVATVRSKALALGAENILAMVADAETLDAEAGYFDLVVIGSAFHRLDRELVAGRVLRWLRPGGYLAVCWSDDPSSGDQDWQRAFAAIVDTWQGEGRVPANWAEPRRQRPDAQVLSDAGFEVTGRREFVVKHHWTLAELAGYARSMSVFPPAVRGAQSAEFDAALAAALGPATTFTATVTYARDLARRPR